MAGLSQTAPKQDLIELQLRKDELEARLLQMSRDSDSDKGHLEQKVRELNALVDQHLGENNLLRQKIVELEYNSIQESALNNLTE